MFFDQPGQYRVYVLGWIPMIVGTLIIAVACFVIGRWTAPNHTSDINALYSRVNDLGALRESLDAIHQEHDALSAKVNANSTAIAALKQQPKNEPDEHLALLSCVINENLAVMEAGKKDFVFIDRDWHLTRMPKYLDLTEEDKRWLSQFVDSK